MNIFVTKDIVKIEEYDLFHKGEYKINKCFFNFSEDFIDSLTKKAIFSTKDISIEVPIINNECDIPKKILELQSIVLIGVYAYKILDDKLEIRYSPSPSAFNVSDGSYIKAINNPEEVSSSQFDKYMQALNDGLNKIESGLIKMDTSQKEMNNLIDDINQKLENGDFNGDIGPQGRPGRDGITPNLQIGIVTTLDPNEQATIIRSGTDEEPVFNFGIPKGKQGIQGIPGRDGINGTDGKDAAINGQNTVNITTDNNIELSQQESDLNLSLNSQLIPKNNIGGSDNIFDDGLGMPLFDLGGDGKSEQVITTGANILDSEDIVNSNGWHTIEITNLLKKGTRYYVKAKIANSTNKKINIQTRIDYVFNDEKKYVFGTYSADGIISVDFQLDNFDTVLIQFKPISDGSVSVDIRNIMLSEKDIPYEPYTGGQPSPSPDYPQPINSIEGSLEFSCRGKNLFNKNNYNSLDTSLSESGLGTQAVGTYKTIYISCKKNTTYTVSKEKDVTKNRFGIAYSDTVPIYDMVTKSNIINANAEYLTITTDNTASYLIAYIWITGQTLSFEEVLDTLQIEEGSVATEYEPYIEPSEVTFNLNDEKLRSVGTVKDELIVDLDTGNYYKIENIGKTILTGGENEQWNKQITPKDQFDLFVNYIINKSSKSIAKSMPNIYPVISDFFIKADTSIWYGDILGIDCYQSAVAISFPKKNKITSVEECKRWLSEHNVVLKYVLETSITKKLGTLSPEDLAKLRTVEGYNNVKINTNIGLMNIRLTYGLNIKKYVDNKIAELSAQLIEGE